MSDLAKGNRLVCKNDIPFTSININIITSKCNILQKGKRDLGRP